MKENPNMGGKYSIGVFGKFSTAIDNRYAGIYPASSDPLVSRQEV